MALRTDKSGYTYLFTEALKKFTPDWEYDNSGQIWSKNITSLPNVILTKETFGAVGEVSNNINSISYVPLNHLQGYRYVMLRLILNINFSEEEIYHTLISKIKQEMLYRQQKKPLLLVSKVKFYLNILLFLFFVFLL